MDQKPLSLRIRMYNVGFGDCFLLRFRYPDEDQHVLIDFGTTKYPQGSEKLLGGLAKKIQRDCKGKLHTLVATHRHRDHIRGFETGKKGETKSGDVIAELKPKVVIQPWTENPAAKRDAKAPVDYGKGTAAFVENLTDWDTLAKYAVQAAGDLQKVKGVDGEEISKALGFIGEKNITNESAVRNLIKMGEDGCAHFVHFGYEGLDNLLPGVEIRVLGPPTLKDSSRIATKSKPEKDDVWNLAKMHALAATFSGLPDADTAETAADNAETVADNGNMPDHRLFRNAGIFEEHPIWSRWMKRHMKKLNSQNLLQIVRRMDKHLNNTSVILLFKVGNLSALFPGDAETESWEFALKDPQVLSAIKDVNVYKVGHHGSANSTPAKLWKEMDNVNADCESRLHSILSTAEGFYGDIDSETEVPRVDLVTALESKTHLASTNKLEAQFDCFDVEMDFVAETVAMFGPLNSDTDETWDREPPAKKKTTKKKTARKKNARKKPHS